jgi:hypothetical protein
VRAINESQGAINAAFNEREGEEREEWAFGILCGSIFVAFGVAFVFLKLLAIKFGYFDTLYLYFKLS